MSDVLEAARKQLLKEGWSIDQVEAALDYAERWARGNAANSAGGDEKLQQTLINNLLPKGIDQARKWLKQSKEQWTR